MPPEMPDGPACRNRAESTGTVTPEWTVLDIISRHRETEKVFKDLEVETGHCICCQGLFLPLNEAAVEFGFEVEPVMTKIERVLGSAKK